MSECRWRDCHQSPAFDSSGGFCYFHAKVHASGVASDGPKLNTCGKYPWDDWFDGSVHIALPVDKFNAFCRQAREAARRRGVEVEILRTGTAVTVRSLTKAAGAA